MMKSIKKDVVRSITMIISVILFTIFLIIDVTLDNWVNEVFDKSLSEKSSYLKSLIKVNEDGLEFDFAGEFMPEFEGEDRGEYFQIWIEEHNFERSESLEYFRGSDLVKQEIQVGSSKIVETILPDGRSGKAIISYFQPQIPAKYRNKGVLQTGNIYLTVAVPYQHISLVLIALDSSLLIVFLSTLFAIRRLISFYIDKGLAPLTALNRELLTLKVDKQTTSLSTVQEEYIELSPIRDQLHRFIQLSQQALQDEQRLTADIAHELKTPIAEIMALTEMSITYPNDIRISDTYKNDILLISQRMKKIVNNLMLLNQENMYYFKQEKSSVELFPFIQQQIENSSLHVPDIKDRVQINNSLNNQTMTLDIISMNVIIKNLIENALFYSPTNSIVLLNLYSDNPHYCSISIENEVETALTQEDISKLFRPLYQADKSRTNNNKHGLGLAIVEKLCKLNDYQLSVDCQDAQKIKFVLTLKFI